MLAKNADHAIFVEEKGMTSVKKTVWQATFCMDFNPEYFYMKHRFLLNSVSKHINIGYSLDIHANKEAVFC